MIHILPPNVLFLVFQSLPTLQLPFLKLVSKNLISLIDEYLKSSLNKNFLIKWSYLFHNFLNKSSTKSSLITDLGETLDSSLMMIKTYVNPDFTLIFESQTTKQIACFPIAKEVDSHLRVFFAYPNVVFEQKYYTLVFVFNPAISLIIRFDHSFNCQSKWEITLSGFDSFPFKCFDPFPFDFNKKTTIAHRGYLNTDQYLEIEEHDSNINETMKKVSFNIVHKESSETILFKLSPFEVFNFTIFNPRNLSAPNFSHVLDLSLRFDEDYDDYVLSVLFFDLLIKVEIYCNNHNAHFLFVDYSNRIWYLDSISNELILHVCDVPKNANFFVKMKKIQEIQIFNSFFYVDHDGIIFLGNGENKFVQFDKDFEFIKIHSFKCSIESLEIVK